jgi:DNA-binding LacI/PurR family transcriptional regulator
MKALNYPPKGIARNLKNRNAEKSIGIIIKELNYPFYTTIAEDAKEYTSSRDCLESKYCLRKTKLQ